MRKLPILLTFTAICFFSCSKDNGRTADSPTTCIERIYIPVNAHSVSAADVALIDDLFERNNIDNSRFRYYRFERDTLQTSFPPYERYEKKWIRVNEYSNSLRILNADLVFQFKNDVFSFRAGETSNGTTLGTTPSLKLDEIREMFLGHIEEFDKNSAQYADSCFKAEFGYFNLNAGISNSTEELVKAWRVTLKNSVAPTEFPVAYYQDANGELIYYDNGIRIFK